jgi:hypothetical protein
LGGGWSTALAAAVSVLAIVGFPPDDVVSTAR